MPAAAHRWTVEERDALPDDPCRRELLDGELLVRPGCSGAHQETLRRLLRLIGDFVEHHGIGTATFAPFDVVYSAHDVLEPDLVVLPAPPIGTASPSCRCWCKTTKTAPIRSTKTPGPRRTS